MDFNLLSRLIAWFEENADPKDEEARELLERLQHLETKQWEES